MIDNSVLAVNLAVEMKIENLTDADWDMLEPYRTTIQKQHIMDIVGTTANFFQTIKAFDEAGCSQNLISHIKYARDIGARWVIING